jgi:leucyl-tRNA synthetase
MFNHKEIENQILSYWKKHDVYKTDINFFHNNPKKKKFYSLVMFPYPSASGLHVGHLKGYTAGDIVARFKKMNGYEVIHPMGWDAFGLPAEQYAIKTGNHPAKFTEENISNFKNQLISLGMSYDFSREVNTTDPHYYKWTQSMFIDIYNMGLAEIKNVNVNWCEELGTGLANEETYVGKDGLIYSERGDFLVTQKPMEQWVIKITDFAKEMVDDLYYLKWARGLKEIQYKWIGDYISSDIKINNNIFNIKSDNPFLLRNFDSIIFNKNSPLTKELDLSNLAKKTKIIIDSVEYYVDAYSFDFESSELKDFLSIYTSNIGQDSQAIIFKKNNNQTDYGEQSYKILNMKLRDWIFSRQRYWGEPFPVLFDKEKNISIDTNLPITLPNLDEIKPSGDGRSPLVNAKDWLEVDIDGKKYTRETNTMPQWAGSCWYYIGYLLKKENNYLDYKSDEAKQILNNWLPADIYIGGQEHAVLHLIYSRFWHKVLYKIGVTDKKEPYNKLINQGMILKDGSKMSKSKGNGINPMNVCDTYGADTLRLYEMFMGPVTQSLEWNDEGILAARKWLERVFRLYSETLESNSYSENLNKSFNNLLKKVLEVMESVENDPQTESKFNTIVSQMMIFINDVYKNKDSFDNKLKRDFVKVLSMFAPFISEYININLLKNQEPLFNSTWPEIRDIKNDDLFTYSVQLNGKFKGVIKVDSNLNDEINIVAKSLDLLGIKKEKIKKTVFVKNKIISFVI